MNGQLFRHMKRFRRSAPAHAPRMFQDNLFSRNRYQADPVSANQAGASAHNQQSWRFIVLEGEKKSELANLVPDQGVDFPQKGFNPVAPRFRDRSIRLLS